MSLTGRWRIVEMDMWDLEDIDLMEPGFIEFSQDRTGQFGFIAVRAGGWTASTASVTDARAPSSPGRARTRATRSATAAGRG